MFNIEKYCIKRTELSKKYTNLGVIVVIIDYFNVTIIVFRLYCFTMKSNESPVIASTVIAIAIVIVIEM